MGKNSSIEWTDHTFNPWWGCTRVSPACKHCYAEAWAHRLGLELWGGRSPRRFFSDAHWREPLRWEADARRSRVRRRVFCASMADVFEARSDLDPWRERLWRLIESTQWLDWLLLTKRPERVAAKVPWGEQWPANVWLGTTVENQLWATKRVPILLEQPAAVRFLSCEPLLGTLDLSQWLGSTPTRAGVDWVIAGGESGSKARPMNPVWARQLRDQCETAGVAFHFKQWGNWGPERDDSPRSAKRLRYPLADGSSLTLVRVSKTTSGRELDGRTWDGVPVSRLVA